MDNTLCGPQWKFLSRRLLLFNINFKTITIEKYIIRKVKSINIRVTLKIFLDKKEPFIRIMKDNIGDVDLIF